MLKNNDKMANKEKNLNANDSSGGLNTVANKEKIATGSSVASKNSNIVNSSSGGFASTSLEKKSASADKKSEVDDKTRAEYYKLYEEMKKANAAKKNEQEKKEDAGASFYQKYQDLKKSSEAKITGQDPKAALNSPNTTTSKAENPINPITTANKTENTIVNKKNEDKKVESVKTDDKTASKNDLANSSEDNDTPIEYNNLDITFGLLGFGENASSSESENKSKAVNDSISVGGHDMLGSLPPSVQQAVAVAKIMEEADKPIDKLTDSTDNKAQFHDAVSGVAKDVEEKITLSNSGKNKVEKSEEQKILLGRTGQNINEAPKAESLTPSDVDFIPPVVQSFVTLFRLYGKQISGTHFLTTLGNSVPSVTSCRRAAHELGLESNLLFRENIADISSLVLPCLLILNNQGTCVLQSFSEEGKIKVIMPEHGNDEMEIEVEKLQEQYSGYAMFVSLAARADRQLRPIEATQERSWFWDVIHHFGPLYRQVAMISVLTNLLVLVGPLFVMNVYDRVVPNLAFDTLWVLAIGALLAYVFEFGLRMLRTYFTEKASHNIDVIVATRIMRHIIGMRLQDRPATSGALISHMREFESLRDFCSASTLLALVDVPFLFMFLWVVYFIGGILVILPLLAIVFLLVVVLFLQYSARRAATADVQGTVEKNAHLVEIVTGVEAIKMASAQNRMLQIWEKISGHCAENTEKHKMMTTSVTTTFLFATQLVSVTLIIWGVYLISQKQLSVGGLIASNILVGRCMSIVVQLAGLTTRIQHAIVAMKTLNQFMALKQEDVNESLNVEFGHLKHDVAFTKVSFSYGDSPLPAISDLNLNIPAGTKLGVMGHMGSGKSTFSKLVAGLYEPQEGTVRFGGVDLRQLDIVELRTRIGYMPQEPVLFHGSVRDNIALGTPYIRDQLILRAAYLAGVTDFIKLHPAGFGMQVGERGNNLSGGQRQAISLARALLHDPDIIILDEPTSNMDNFTEEIIKRRLLPVLEKKTLIINMHRTSLLSLVDNLLIIKEGKLSIYGEKNKVIAALNKK